MEGEFPSFPENEKKDNGKYQNISSSKPYNFLSLFCSMLKKI